jgi:long-chain acyl-CoA synthetase
MEIKSSDNSARTFPALFQEQCARGGDRIAYREKEYGIWQSYTWTQAWAHVRDLAEGLAALGFRRGDRLCIVGDNRPHLYWGMLAAQSLGGVPVPLYQDSIEREMQFIVEHAEARFALVEDQEQADKLINVKEQCSTLQHVIYRDPRGMRKYDWPYLLGYEALCEKGRAFAKDHPGHLDREIALGREEDLAVICYTSGTTGRPKGVMLTHKNFAVASDNVIRYERMHEENMLAYLPMAWIGDFCLSFAMAIAGGYTVNCPESGATVMQDLREAGPTLFIGPPRIWENLLTSVMIRMDDAAWIKRKMFNWFVREGVALEKARERGGTPSWLARIANAVGNLLVYSPLRDSLGLSRIRIAYTAGEAIGPELLTFFRAIGVNLKQLYGQTEASVFVAMQQDGGVKSDTCGPPVPWVEVKVSDSGEVLYRGPGVFKGYFKNEEATKAAFDGDWVKTGDAGFIDHDGHLKIVDRVKDVSRLSNGTLFAPKFLENKVKYSPFVKECVCVGQGRGFVAALVNIDAQAVGNWCERHNITYTSYTDLAQKPEVYDLIAEEIAKANGTLAGDEQLRGAQIHKFLILHKELDADDEEVTRTRKLRRGFIAEKYKDLIDALFSGAGHVTTQTKVTFEDGRTALVKADLGIRDVKRAA